MRKLVVCALTAGVLLLCPLPSVAGVTPPFTECPAVGLDISCSVLFVGNPNSTLSIYSDHSQRPFDDVYGTVVSMLSNSSASAASISVTDPVSGFFDRDGACAGLYSPSPGGCPASAGVFTFGYPVTGYEGYDNLGDWNYFSNDFGTSLTVSSQGGGLPPDETAWFGLEGPPNAITGVTAELGCLILLGTGLLALGRKLRFKA
jgi:hypothetical protein